MHFLDYLLLWMGNSCWPSPGSRFCLLREYFSVEARAGLPGVPLHQLHLRPDLQYLLLVALDEGGEASLPEPLLARQLGLGVGLKESETLNILKYSKALRDEN